MTQTRPAAGYRLVRVKRSTFPPYVEAWVWRHPLEVQADDLDATDMSGPEFEDAVRKSEKPANSA
jgi:hypothetical protein